MKKFALILAAAMLFGILAAGCRRNDPQEPESTGAVEDILPSVNQTETTGSTDPTQTGTKTQAGQILGNIWAQYGDEERFAVYGGAVENSVADAPGDLDMENEEELMSRYLLPEGVLVDVSEGASLVHLMNNNIFTAVAVKTARSPKETAKAWRDSVQQNRWICGQPDRLLMADVDGDHLLLAFGSEDAMNTFKTKLESAYPQAQILYHEAIVA